MFPSIQKHIRSTCDLFLHINMPFSFLCTWSRRNTYNMCTKRFMNQKLGNKWGITKAQNCFQLTTRKQNTNEIISDFSMFWNLGNTPFLSPIIYSNYPKINICVYIFYVPITIFLAVTIFFFHAVVDADYYLSRTVNVFLTWIQQNWAKNGTCIISFVKVNVFP